METYDYAKEYYEAFERTQAWGLITPKKHEQSGRLFADHQDQKLLATLQSAFSNIGPKDISAQCFAIHNGIRPAIDRTYNVSSVLTLGWVHDPPCDLFRISEEELASIARNGIKKPTLNLHCWLTLPTQEILDCTLATTKAFAEKKPENIGLAMARHWGTFTGGLRYHPMIVGEDFLEKAGILLTS